MRKYVIALALAALAASYIPTVVRAASVYVIQAVVTDSDGDTDTMFFQRRGQTATFESLEACNAFKDSDESFKQATASFVALQEALGSKVDVSCAERVE